MEGVIGEIRMFGGNFAPRTWSFCEGQLLAISSHTALFSILGTTYGGDGRTTFALPDLRGRSPIGPGTGPGLSTRKLGQRGGSETNTLSLLQLPVHNHFAQLSNATGVAQVKIPVSTDSSLTNEVEEGYLGQGGSAPDLYAENNTSPTYLAEINAPVSVAGNVTVGNAGASQPVNNMQPWLGIYYIICLQGVFPSRN